MRLAKHNNALETNAELVSQDFGIGDASVVIEILRNRLYSHPIRTLVQEYMSNGRDATREIKSKNRIVVTVPNSLNPVFKVRDFGPGISPERMANVFVKYGASTKRNSNGQTGGFGIGAKSAWSYTDSFTIISITDGIKRTYVAHTGVNNQGRLDLLSEVNTDEANGAEIQVGVKREDTRAFEAAIFRACYFWNKAEYPEFKGVSSLDTKPRGPSLVTIEGSKNLAIEVVRGHELPDYTGLRSNYYGHSATVVVDGIPYDLTDKLKEGAKNLSDLLNLVKAHAIIHVGNGDVEVSASRENIADSDFTRQSLDGVAALLRPLLVDFIKTKFKDAKSNAEWIETFKSLHTFVQVEQYSKRGNYSITGDGVQSLDFSQFDLLCVGKGFGRRNRGGFKRETITTIPTTSLNHIFYLDTLGEPIVTQNRRIKEYLNKVNESRAILIVPREKVDLVAKVDKAGKAVLDSNNNPVMVSKVRHTLQESTKVALKVQTDLGARDLSTLTYTMPVRVPKAKRDRTKEMFTTHVVSINGKHPETTQLATIEDEDKNFLYVPFEKYNGMEIELRNMVPFCVTQGYEICALTDASIEMVQGSKHFQSYEDWKSNFKVTKKITIAALASKAKNIEVMRDLCRSTETVKDKFLAKMMSQYRDILENKMVEVPETIIKMIKDEVKEFTENDAALTKSINTSYPLIGALSGGYSRITSEKLANELVTYINSKA